jgi:hypothetical protein
MFWYHGKRSIEPVIRGEIDAMKYWLAEILWSTFVFVLAIEPAWAINGGTPYVIPRNGWKAFEVITAGNTSVGYTMPDEFDGLGAWLPDASTLRVEINHELVPGAVVSEVNLNLANFQSAIRNMIGSGSIGGVTFVDSAQQAWTSTVGVSDTSYSRFCSSQSYVPNAFGANRGFADNIYIMGEEVAGGRLFAVDLGSRTLYQLSGVTGPAGGGNNGIPTDPWENAALLDTGETDHVALLLSPDGGSQSMKLYIGDKGKAADGSPSTSFLAKNGLVYGHNYYLNMNGVSVIPPATGSPATSGTFGTSASNPVSIFKLEDVDTNPNNGTQVVQGVQETGLFTYDFNLVFSGGTFSTAASTFSLKKIQEQHNDLDGQFGDADNVDWTMATTLGGVNYPNGLIFVNEDSDTFNGETWMTTPTAGAATALIADTYGTAGTETSGILDISKLVGYKAGSVLLTTNQGVGSLTVLINPNAALAGDFDGNGVVDAADYVVWRKGPGTIYTASDYDTWRAQFGRTPSSAAGAGGGLGSAAVPEPTGIALVGVAALFCIGMVSHLRR